MMSSEADLLAAAQALAGYVWHLLETQGLLKNGSYTFPDGETWRKEELVQWKRRRINNHEESQRSR